LVDRVSNMSNIGARDSQVLECSNEIPIKSMIKKIEDH